MPSYTIHYSDSADGPPIGWSSSIAVSSLREAFRFAERTFPPRSHRPAMGHALGFCICNEQNDVVLPWREGRALETLEPDALSLQDADRAFAELEPFDSSAPRWLQPTHRPVPSSSSHLRSRQIARSQSSDS